MMQVLLEWSIDQYEVQFSLYRDNIAGRSFENKYVILCDVCNIKLLTLH